MSAIAMPQASKSPQRVGLDLVRYLRAKASIARDLYREGRITQTECFRHETDLAVLSDSGPIEDIQPRPPRSSRRRR